MTCTVEMRAQATDIADQLRAQPQIETVDVLAPTDCPYDEWAIEVIVERSRVPAQVLLALGAHGLAIETPVQSRGKPAHTQVVAPIPR